MDGRSTIPPVHFPILHLHTPHHTILQRPSLNSGTGFGTGPRMPVGLLTLELHIPDAQSLKDKRQVLRSLKDKLRREFNVAIAELDHHDAWQRSVVGVVTLSNEEKHVREMLQKVLDKADEILGSFLINQRIEIV